ncbi:MAG: Aminopeptidase YwaD precursor [Candidatus Heimdallarchaeota archaeon LC_3]|nr:MAG: Aminopeptidase YwaD precursor [Candidatus Heimdallarchaeota archaeon LC_3]
MNQKSTISLGILILIITSFSLVLINDYLNQSNQVLIDEDITDILVYPLYFDGSESFKHLKNQVDIGFRYPGTHEINLTRSYITNHLNLFNWTVIFHNFTFKGIDVTNILAFPANATNTTLSSTRLFGAHYDTRIKADRDPIEANKSLPVLGANDGASGVAILLEMARIYKNSTNIGLFFIDAEDQGGAISGWNYIEGSREFAGVLENFFPNGANSIASFILFDMIGDKDLNIPRERNSNNQLMNEIWESAKLLGFDNFFLNQPGYAMTDDHIPFKDAGVPVVDLIDFDYLDEDNRNLHHTTRDNLDYVSEDSLKIVGQTIEFWLRTLDIWSTS